MSILELAIKIRKGKLELTLPLREWIDRAMETGDFVLLPLDQETLISANELPGDFHPDPADRLIVATARLRGLVLVTGDARIRQYPHVQSVWD